MDARLAEDALSSLLGRGELRASRLALRPFPPGGNNRAWLVETGDGRKLVAKAYFQGRGDDRDRLGAEWALLNYASIRLGLACVPRPIMHDAERGIGIYEYVDGRKLMAEEVGANEVASAARFFRALNGSDRHAMAAHLPAASEACFSLAEHLELVERRLARLETIEPATDVDVEAIRFIAELRATWNLMKERTQSIAYTRGWALSEPLNRAQRCVSPSDFGFHNAILQPSGAICFIDFEYAGWDDPAKMAADFFSHPAVAVSPIHMTAFLDTALTFSEDPALLKQRTLLLLPVLRIKWCCIMMNEFLPEAARRRRFADPGTGGEQRKRTQLAKARQALHRCHGYA